MCGLGKGGMCVLWGMTISSLCDVNDEYRCFGRSCRTTVATFTSPARNQTSLV